MSKMEEGLIVYFPEDNVRKRVNILGCKSAREIFHIILISLLIGIIPIAAAAQLLGNDVRADGCASGVGGDVVDSSITVICGMPYEQVVVLVRSLSSPDPAVKAEALALLRARLPIDSRFQVEAIGRFLEILGQNQIEPKKLPDFFARIANENLRLRKQLSAFKFDDADVQALRELAAAAVDRVDQDAARQYLETARQIIKKKRVILHEALGGVLN